MSKSIYIFNRGEFDELTQDELKNKAIIRIHSNRDKDWYDTGDYPVVLQVYFDDLKKDELKWYEKKWANNPGGLNLIGLIAKWKGHNAEYPMNSEDAKKIINFIRKYKKLDFIIHGEYGQSRSVAVGLFIQKYYNGKIENLTSKQQARASVWVSEMLEKNK